MGVVFSSSRNVPTLPAMDKGSSSSALSFHDVEKAVLATAYDESILANYLVPALEKGQKNTRQKPASLWIRLRVWYNPYRIVGFTNYWKASTPT